ncbi:hypothetical protein [Parasitella parasitica]|uniref:Uncharacterized protein n=1 Tax=Parasitella parasitica TaxID=35722 RepID=A0A0B7MX29_9FUNG|nr:hypothetical protein [Parasitella parasitica]
MALSWGSVTSSPPGVINNNQFFGAVDDPASHPRPGSAGEGPVHLLGQHNGHSLRQASWWDAVVGSDGPSGLLLASLICSGNSLAPHVSPVQAESS